RQQRPREIPPLNGCLRCLSFQASRTSRLGAGIERFTATIRARMSGTVLVKMIIYGIRPTGSARNGKNGLAANRNLRRGSSYGVGRNQAGFLGAQPACQSSE